MSKLKNNNVLLGIGVARSSDGEGEYYCFTARLRPMDSDNENLSRSLRDLGRALQTFALIADVEGPSDWAAQVSNTAVGPFAMPNGQEHFGSIVIVPARDADPERVARQLRSGLNAAAALLRSTGYYRVSIKYRPVEQLHLNPREDQNPEGDAAEFADPDTPEEAPPEEAPAEEAPAEESTAEENTSDVAKAEDADDLPV